MALIDDEYGTSLKSSCIFRQIRAFFWKPAPGTNSGTYLRIGITSTKNAPKLAAAEIVLAAVSASSMKGSSVCCIWRPYANDKAMPPMALKSVNDEFYPKPWLAEVDQLTVLISSNIHLVHRENEVTFCGWIPFVWVGRIAHLRNGNAFERCVCVLSKVLHTP